MNATYPTAVLLTWLALSTGALGAESAAARWWLTTANLEFSLAEQPPLSFEESEKPADASANSIVIDGQRTFQKIQGMGSSLEHATCYNLSRLAPEKRAEVLRRLFNPVDGIGINLARICIGTPDFTIEPWYTFDDMPAGEKDHDLVNFSIEKDRRYILPILKQALAENPDLRFFASPWSPPGWMKSSGDLIGGTLRPESYDSYARYFVKFIRAYGDEGIPIHAVTIQNEPGVDRSQDSPRWRYPSCRFTAEQERDFIKGHLGPALRRAGLKTEIWTYDHNFNEQPTTDGDDPGINYPRTVLNDPDAAPFVAGVAFHGYAGKPSGMSAFHAEFPQIPIHFTEGSVFGLVGGRTLIEYLSHWASSYNGWVTMLDVKGKPNNGPFSASRTCITIDHQSDTVKYHYDYFQYGHFFRFMKRGASRIDSKGGDQSLASLAVRNPSGEIAVVIVHLGHKGREVLLAWDRRTIQLSLPPRSISTVTWEADK